jgi:polyisoprenoid-binding protein YceI
MCAIELCHVFFIYTLAMKHLNIIYFSLAITAASLASTGYAQSAGTAKASAAKPAAVSAAPAQKLVLAQSSVGFVSRQMGVPVEGKFKRFDVQSNFDPKKPEVSKVSLTIDLTSADIGNAETEGELKKPGWFDSAKRPQASFVSNAIKSVSAGKFEIDGQLTIKGNTQRVLVPISVTQSGDTTLASGAFQIKRIDFKIGDGEWNDVSIVANEVQVNFKLTLTGVPKL